MQISLMFLYLIFGRYYLFRSLFHSAIFHLHAFLIYCLRLPSSSMKLAVMYGALCITSKAHPLSIALDFFLIFYPLYLNTLTISLSPPTSWLHLFNIPVSTKPHFSMTLPDAGLPVKWSAQMFSKCFSLMQ